MKFCMKLFGVPMGSDSTCLYICGLEILIVTNKAMPSCSTEKFELLIQAKKTAETLLMF